MLIRLLRSSQRRKSRLWLGRTTVRESYTKIDVIDVIIAICAKNENLIRFYSGKDGTIISSLQVVQKGTTVTDL